MRRWCRLMGLVLAMGLLSCGHETADNVKKSYWPNRNLKSELRYQGDQLNGLCCWYYENGKPEMEVVYKDNRMNGLSRRWYENGILMEEAWYKDGLQDSIARGYSLKGHLVSESYYVGGKLNGEYKRWYDNGQVFQEGQFVDDMMDGSWLIFYPEGGLAAKADFDRGTGVQTSYEQSGYRCLVTNYVDNVKHGREVYYNPDGRVTRVAIYENGEWIRDE